VTSITTGTIDDYSYAYGTTYIEKDILGAFTYLPAACTGIYLELTVLVDGSSTLPSAFSITFGKLKVEQTSLGTPVVHSFSIVATDPVSGTTSSELTFKVTL
jgi:hypothetical protein